MSIEAIGRNIKVHLQMKKITYEEFAERIGVSTVTVARWISAGAVGRMKVDMLFRVAEELGTTVDALVREEPECTDDAKSVGKG